MQIKYNEDVKVLPRGQHSVSIFHLRRLWAIRSITPVSLLVTGRNFQPNHVDDLMVQRLATDLKVSTYSKCVGEKQPREFCSIDKNRFLICCFTTVLERTICYPSAPGLKNVK